MEKEILEFKWNFRSDHAEEKVGKAFRVPKGRSGEVVGLEWRWKWVGDGDGDEKFRVVHSVNQSKSTSKPQRTVEGSKVGILRMTGKVAIPMRR